MAEYRDRLAALSTATVAPTTTIESLIVEEEETLAARKAAVQAEERVDVFQGLPTSRLLALREIDRVHGELTGLIMKRDALFEGLVDGKTA